MLSILDVFSVFLCFACLLCLLFGKTSVAFYFVFSTLMYLPLEGSVDKLCLLSLYEVKDVFALAFKRSCLSTSSLISLAH